MGNKGVVGYIPVGTTQPLLSGSPLHLHTRTSEHGQPEKREQDGRGEGSMDKLSDGATSRDLGDEGTDKG